MSVVVAKDMYKLLKRSKYFDAKWYLKQYPDVAKSGMSPARHYLEYGWRENRNPGPKFNTNFYMKTYLDVKSATMCPLVHYETIGRAKGNKISANMVVKQRQKKSKDIKPYDIIKKSKYFDAKWYLKQYSDVARSGINVIEHFLKYGWREGRNPGPKFNTRDYLFLNDDVARAGVCPLVHYELYGKKEGRLFVKQEYNYSFFTKTHAWFTKQMTRSKKTILLVSHEFSYTGAPLSLLSAAKIFHKNGYQIITLSLKDGPLKTEFAKLGRVVVSNKLRDCAYYGMISDNAIVNTIVPFQQYNILKKIVPTQLWIREKINSSSESAQFHTIKNAENVYVVSEYSKQSYASCNPNVRVLKHGIEDEYSETPIDAENISFAVIGSICKNKAQDIFVRAIKSIPAAVRNRATFYIVGKCFDDKMMAEIKKSKIKNLIVMPEISDRAQMIKFYEGISCVVIPSLDESASRVAIEAMMMGRPAIMSKNVGAQYLLNGKNGILVNTGSVNGLARAMRTVIENPKKLLTMSKHARLAYLKHNSIEVYEQNLLKSVREKKMLVHLHLFYHNQLDWFLKKFKNITCDYDLFVTVTEQAEIITKKLKAFKPDVKIVKVPNRGYDIYPFWLVLQQVKLSEYGCVLKVHTKNTRNTVWTLRGINYTKYQWRNDLINPLCGSKKLFKHALRVLQLDKVGMVYSHNFGRDIDNPAQVSQTKQLCESFGYQHARQLFVCGTMFLMRADILQDFKAHEFKMNDFANVSKTASVGTLAHSLETFFGIIVAHHGTRAVGVHSMCTYIKQKYANSCINLNFITRIRKYILQRQDDRNIIRNSHYFNKKWYLKTYPDIAEAKIDAAYHYVKYGWRESRNPGPKFNTRAYLIANPDVARVGQNPLLHYERYGRFERRALFPANGIQSTSPKPFNYKTYNDLAFDIKKNIEKIPSNIDLIVGIPRSGMIPAYIMGLALNKKVCSTTELVNGLMGNSGFTRKTDTGKIKNILVVDDTVNTGLSLGKVKPLLAPLKRKYNIKYCAVYATNSQVAELVDIALNILPQPRMFQWNYQNHSFLANACFDMDGVLCWDPTDEQNDDGKRYIEFIKNADPLYVPKVPIGYIVTSRLEKYRKETEQWLAAHGIKYKKLYMLNKTAEERRRLGLHAPFKASVYKQITDSNMFIESNPTQAAKIANLSGKPCICCLNDKIYT